MADGIVLVVPPSRSHYVVPPIGLGYLASCLRRAGFKDVGIIDSIKEKFTVENLGRFMAQKKPRIIGFQVFSCDLLTVRRCVELIRGKLPGVTILVGGPHVSATSGEVFRDLPGIDYGFVGEAETGLPLLVGRVLDCADVALANIPGLVWRTQEGVRVNDRALIDDLDALPFPAWDLMPPESYPDAPQGAFYKQFPIAPIASSRGCPYSCAFCGSPVNMGKRLRMRSLPNLFEEMELLRNTYGVREFHFIDDMFNASKKRVVDFCQILEAKQWGISYTFPNGLRLNTIDEEMLTHMKRSGAYAFTVGIESGSQRILDAMKKNLTVEMIREKVELIKEAGLEPSGFFLLGFPGETREDMELTLRFALSLPLKRAHFSNFLPLPGTEATQKLLETGEIATPEGADLAYSKVPYAPVGMSRAELKAFQRKAFLRFHLRPSILLKMIKEIKSLFHLRSLLARAKDYLWSS